MIDRGNLDLAIARAQFLRYSERIKLAQALDREDDLSLLSLKDLENLLGRSLVSKKWLPRLLLEQAGIDRARAEKRGISFASILEPSYPPLLRELSDPPNILFYRGLLPNPEQPLLAMVGTREPSAAASTQAYTLARQFGTAGLAVVSGLARGIDGFAHRGNLDGGAPSIAVLGSGLDEVYPRSNRDIARRIVEAGGALISEYAPGEAPLAFHFPARNRLIAGIARTTLVIQAPERSGALITAEYALDAGRDLWVGSSGCVGSRCEGTQKLAAEGARVCSSARMILDDWDYGSAPSYLSEDGLAELSSGKDLALALARSLEFKLK
ncbi:DNA-processing protein DprA [Treponema sp.]